jgi:apolipoprotein N-acyltransferase
MYYNYKDQGMPVEAVVVQPNIDSYTEKDTSSSSFIPHAHQIDRLLTLSKEQLTPATGLVVWPESALNFWIDESMVYDYVWLQPIRQWLDQLPALSLITGVSSFRSYGAIKATKTARKNGRNYMDCFNSIFHLKAGNTLDIYHKEKRLPFGEYIPYYSVLPEWISSWIRQKFIDLGNIDPCFGQGSGSKVFEINPKIKVAAINCYDSLYGAFVGSAVQKGANLLTITTNDNWWGDTPIYHHHFQYSRLLAIAHRKSLIRSANTGISGFINQRGDAIAKTQRLVPAALRQVVYANNQMTFYSLYGDYIGHIAAWACLLLFFILFIARLKYLGLCSSR